MKLVPRNYFIDDMFNDFMTTNASTMKCDVYEKGGNYNIEVDIPGFNKDEISIESSDGYITISAEKKEEKNDEEKNYICHERKYGKVQRSFYLGDINPDNITAKFENGILKLNVPKMVEKENKKLIEIE